MQNSLTFPRYYAIANPFFSRLRISLKAFLVILSLIAALSAGYYILQVNNLISKTYIIQKDEKQLTQLEKENSNLEAETARINSLYNIEGLVKNLNFEKSNNTRYIKILSNQVARE